MSELCQAFSPALICPREAGEVGSLVVAQRTASIPIGWLLQSGSGICKDWPLDFSTLNGTVQIQVTFHPSSYFIQGVSTLTAIPAATTAVATTAAT